MHRRLWWLVLVSLAGTWSGTRASELVWREGFENGLPAGWLRATHFPLPAVVPETTGGANHVLEGPTNLSLTQVVIPIERKDFRVEWLMYGDPVKPRAIGGGRLVDQNAVAELGNTWAMNFDAYSNFVHPTSMDDVTLKNSITPTSGWAWIPVLSTAGWHRVAIEKTGCELAFEIDGHKSGVEELLPAQAITRPAKNRSMRLMRSLKLISCTPRPHPASKPSRQSL